jgi:HK97 family phage portal protein
MSLGKRISAAVHAFRSKEYWEAMMDSLKTGYQGHAGVAINQTKAETYSAVWASLVLITETISTIPLQIFRKTKNGRDVYRDHPLYPVLHDVANKSMTAQQFRETLQWNIEMRGIGLAEKVRDRNGFVRELWPISPDALESIEVDKGGTPLFVFTNGKTWGPDKIFYCYGPGSVGMQPRSRLKVARESIGLGLAAEEYGSRFFGQGTNTGGFLSTDKALKKETFDRLKESVNDKYSGLGKAHKLVILEEGLKFEKAGMANDDAQFLETRKFQISEIARFFGLKPHMVGDLEHATFSNIEHMGIEAVRYSWRPRTIRLEQAINMQLLNEQERKYLYVEHNLDGLMQGDLKSQMEAWHIGLQDGVFNANEVRQKLNMNAQVGEQGEIYYMPLNMQDKSTVGMEQKSLRDGIAVEFTSRYGDKFDTGKYYRSVDKMNIHDEPDRQRNAYRYAAMQAAGVEYVIWRSNPDCPHCQDLNGEVRKIGEYFKDKYRHPPIATGCTCNVEAVE